MKRHDKKKPLIRALEPRILFDGAAVTTAVSVIDESTLANTSTDSTTINDATVPDAPTTSTDTTVPLTAGDIFIITTDTPNYEVTAQNFAADFKVLVLDQNSDNLKAQILDATKDLDKELNVHIIAVNQNRDKLLVGSYDSVDDLVGGLTSDSKLYDLTDLSEQNFTQSGLNQVVIIDEAVSYSQDLLDSIPSDWKVIKINSLKDGLTQILEQLDGISNLSAIHIFSHANAGELILGNLSLDSSTLNTRANELKALGTHLNSTGDILLYGCDVSSGFIGVDFVNELAFLTGADIAASDDKTGTYISNADFNLETTTGNIETQTITYDTDGTVLGYINNYTFDINKNGPRLNYQASGEAFSGWWNGTDNNWVDYYTSNQEVSYFGIKWITVNALFFSFSFPIPWINYYSYGTGVRYGVQDFTISYDSKFQLTASANSATQDQLGGDRTQDVLAENYALYKKDANGVGFDKYNPLKNLVTASEGLFGGALYYGELEAGEYQVVASFDTWRWFPDIISLMTLNQYAEQFFEPVTLRVEDLNKVPVWGSIANQTINGDGNKDIIATTWSNVSDADGNPITVEAVLSNGAALPSWLTFNPNTLSFSGNPPANTGTLTIRLKAFDGHGENEFGYKDFQLTFTNDNDRPIVANEIKDTTWDGQGSFSYQIPTNTFTDADPGVDSFTYSAKLVGESSLPSWLSISSSGLISGNPPADFANLQIIVTVNDGSNQLNATQTDTFILNLKNNNDIATVNDRIITIDEDTTHIFSLADFVYTDLDTHSNADTLSGTGKTIQSIRIVEVPTNGILWLDADSDGVLDNGETVQTNQVILASSISKLKYTPNANWAGHGVLTPLNALITGPDSFKWVSSDGYNESSNIATTTLNVRLVNDSPVLSFSAGKTLNIRPNGGSALSAVYVDEGLNLIDPDAVYSNDTLFDTIFGISVTIVDSTTNKFVTGDTLSLTGSTSGFTVSYDSVNGILTIEKAGGAKASEYQTILRTLQFSSTDTTNNNLRTLGLSFRTQDVGSKTSAYFDGVDDYIETMNASIPTSGDFTVSVWAKLDNPSSLIAENYSIFGQGDGANHVYLAIQKNSDGTYKLRIGDDWTITNISSLLSDGNWHQYTVTKSGNSSSDGSVYIDGKYIASGNIKDYIAAGYGLRIGKLYDKTFNSADDWTGYFKGSISDLRVYNKTLGALDIQKSLSNTLVGNESGLRAWYKLVSDYKNYATVSSDGGNAVIFKEANYGYSIKTGHYYKFDTTSKNYSTATTNAQSSTYAGENGYLLRLDDSLSASEMEVAKMLESLKGASVSWIGAERSYSNGDWYWTAGPDSDVYFNHGSNEGLDNDPAYEGVVYTGGSGRFANSWWSTGGINIYNLQTQVTFTYYSWDSWDNEALAVNLNGIRLYNHYRSHGSPNGNTLSGTTNISGYNISWTIVPLNGWSNFGYSGWWDQSFSVTINIPQNFTSNLTLDFGAYVDQDVSDESAQISDIVVRTYNPEYLKDKAYMTSTGYIDNTYSSSSYQSLIEYGNKGEVLLAPSLFATTNTALPDKYVNETRSITVRQTNNAPTQTESWVATTIDEDGQNKFTVINFTSKFSDTDADTLSKIIITSIPDSSKGVLLLNGVVLSNNAEIPTGDLDKLVFKATANFNGEVSFKYKGSDGYLLTNESTVSITINAINDAPIITSNQTLTAINEDILTDSNTGQTIASLISDGTITDVDGSAIESIAITSINNSYGTWQYKLANGSWANISNITGAKINLGVNALLLDSDSFVRFIPNANFYGTSTFEFRAWDKSSGTVGGTTNPLALGGNNSVSSEVKTATITINSVNDTPTTESKTIAINEDVNYVFTTNDFKFSDVDTNDVLTSVKITTLPALGTIKLNGANISANDIITKADIDAGKLTYITALNGNGSSYSSFNFTVFDGTINSSSATITFDATDTNDAPTAISWASGGSVAEDKISTSSSSTIVGQLSAIDPNTGDTLRFTQLSNNKFVINPDGTVKLAISPKDLSGNNVALLDYELKPTEIIKVKVTDSQGLTYETDMTVAVTNVTENKPNLYTNVLYATKGSITTLTESYIRTVDADTPTNLLTYTVKQAINGGKLFIDNNGDGAYNEGTDTLLGPESSDTPEYEANFTHADVVAGKIKFLKDDTQINAKISLEVSDGTSTDEGLVVVIVSNPPVLSAAIDDQEWSTLGAQSFTIPASTFTDADFDILTYNAKLSNVNKDPLPSWLHFDPATGKFSGDPDDGSMANNSTLSITVTASDGRSASTASDTFIITFKTAITKPVLANPLPEYIEFNGSGVRTAEIANTFTDPTTNGITYTATLGNGNLLPTWLSFRFDATTNKLIFSGNPPASAVSEPLILKITASNGTVENPSTTSTTIKLYISDPNDIPVNSTPITEKVISGTTTYTYTISKSTFTDGDGDTITLSLATQDGSEVPSWIKTTTASNGDLIITAKAPAGSGFQNLRVLGSDGNGGNAVSDFKITYSGGTNESPQVKTSAGISYMQNGVLVTSPNGALEKFSILAGKTSIITTTYLDENDNDDDGIGLIYTIVNEPLYGQLWIDSDGDGTINGSEKTLSAGNTFTQKDIDDRKLKYKHTAANILDDKFVFNLKDGGEDSSVEVKNVTFNIDVLENTGVFSLLSVARYNPTDTLTNADTVQFKVKFSGVTYKVDATDFVLTGAGASNTNATISSVTNLGSNEYMITVSNITSNTGALGIALAGATDIITSGGNAIDKTYVPSINETFTLDNTAPTVTITPDKTIYAGTTPFTATLTFSEKIGGLSTSDLTASNATISNLVKINDTQFRVTVTPTSDTNSIILNFASAKVTDTAGNDNSAAAQVTITRNSLPTISNLNTTSTTFTEIDGIDDENNAISFSASGLSLGDADLTQGLQSLKISIPTVSIKDGAKEELIVNGTVIPLNFTNGKAISNIIISGVEYKITVLVDGTNSTLTFEKASGKMSLAQAEALLDVIKYNNTSELPTVANRVFSLIVNDGLENSATSTVTISVVSTNDTPTISVETGNSAIAGLAESNTTLNASGTLSIVDLDGSGALSVNENNTSNTTTTNNIGNALVEKPTAGNAASSVNAPTLFDPGAVLNVPDISSYVTIADANELDLQNQTISMWLKPDGVSSLWQPLIMKAKGDGDGLTRNFSLWINEKSLQLHYSITIGSINYNFTTNDSLTQNTWNFVSATYDGSTMKLYINGVVVGSLSASGTVYKGTESLYIGGLPTPASNYGEFNGDIAEVRIYNTALDSTAISNSMKTQLTGTEANLVYYTRFDTDANGKIVDLTATNNSGTLNGSSVVLGQLSVNEDSSHTFNANEFSTNYLYTDPNSNAFSGIKVINLPTNGTLKLSGVGVVANQIISSTDIANLVYTANSNFSGADRFYFKAIDSTYATTGDLSNTEALNITVKAINDAPTTADKTISINKNVSTLLSANDFTYSDIDNDIMASVKITTLPTAGTLQYYNGTSWQTVISNQVITKADIDANKLRFTPVSNQSGNTYATFKFSVNDGTTNSTEKTITYDVIAADVSILSVESVAKTGIITGLISSDAILLEMLNLSVENEIINWDFNSASEHFDYLAINEVLTLTYTIKATDSNNPSISDTQDITITITGTNDKPNITASTTTALDNNSTTKISTASGAISFSDIDATDTPTASFVKETDTSYTAVRASSGNPSFTLNTDAITALKDALTLNSNGSWTYSLNTTFLKDTSDNLIALGDKITITYSVKISDENNASITKDLKFTFIGTGTGASLIVNGDAGSIIEGLKLSDAGSITFDGQATITTATINSTVNITASTLTLTTAQKTAIKNAFVISVADNASTDAVNWTYNVSETNLNFLPENEIVTAVFTVDIFDNQSTPTKIGSQNVTIVINGTNDTPIITSTTADARGSVTEAGNSVTGTASASDTLTSSDVDSGATKTWSLNTTSGTYGIISINSSTGAWTYTLDDTLAAALQTGDKKTETFIATVTDDKGATKQQTIIVEVNGTNDAPVLTILDSNLSANSTIAYTDTSANNSSTITSQSGTLSASDDDASDTKTYSITSQSADTTQTDYTHSKVGTYGTLYLNAISGAYKYIPNDAKIEALTAIASETFSFTVTDSQSVSDTKTLTISITATNDTPVISIGSADSASDSLYETNTTLSTNGTLSLTDLDKTQTVSVSNVSVVAVQRDATVNHNPMTSTSQPSDTTLLAMLSLNSGSVIDNTTTTGTINWAFNSNGFNSANLGKTFDYLAVGETLSLTYTIKATDSESQDSANQTIVITITGTNDAPTITLESGDSASASLTESNTTLSATDTLTVNEVELSDTVTASVESVSINSISTVSNLALPTNAILKAMLSLTGAVDGVKTLLSNSTSTNEALIWTFNSGSEHFDKIAAGQTLVLDYVVKIADNANPSKIDTRTVTITINGTNNAPIIDTYDLNDVNINGVIKSGKPLELADTGTITFTDIDFSNRPTASETLKSITALRRDTTVFTLTQEQTTNITNAFNISAAVDNTNSGFVNWEYAISQANVDFLGAGEQVVAIFTITVSDGVTTDIQDIKVTLTGDNKTPTLTASTEDLTEGNAAFVDTIAMTASDGNMSDSLSISVLSGTYQLNNDIPIAMTDTQSYQLGWLSLNTMTYPNSVVDGTSTTSSTFNWNFNTGTTTFDSLNTGDTVKLIYTVQVIDDAPSDVQASSTKTVTVTITGTNDAPVAIIDVANSTENSPITIDVLANDTDIDSLDNSSNFTLDSVSITTNNHSNGYDSSKVTTPATVTIVNNKLLFTPNDEFDYLAKDDTATVVVTYIMSDDENVTSTNTTTITITGTNDAPTISIGTADKASEDFIESINTITTSGTLSLNDKDTLNTVSASVESVTLSGNSQVGSLTNAYFKSMLSFASSDILDNAHNDGTITWNFNSGNDIFDYVAKDEELILTYSIKALDSSGGFDNQEVIIKITGTNDSPVLNAIPSKTYTDTNVNDTFNNYSGTLVSSDADLTDIKTYSITNQIVDISETGFTHSKLGNYGKLHLNENTGAYKYIPNDALIEELTTNQTDEFIFNVTDDSDDINNIDTKTFTINLIGVNDTPTVLLENIDEQTPFGKEYIKQTAYLFSDLDKNNIFTFEASNLPLGLKINPNTGEITGRAVESGIFTIILKVTDSGTPALNVERTFSLLVIAPAQNDSGQTTQTTSGNELVQQIIKEITVDRINDMINSSDTGKDTKNSTESLLNGENNGLSGKTTSGDNLDISKTELTSILQASSNSPTDKITRANASLNLGSDGKVSVDNKANKAFGLVGLTIEKIELVQEQLEIKILDTKVGQKYIVTLLDGSELPDTLSFDPNTGKIIGMLPDGMNELNISIRALSNDGTTRVLNLKIDLKDLKQKLGAFNSLSEQIDKQSFKMSNYGSFITSLFDKTIA